MTAILAIGPQHRPGLKTEARWRDWTANLPEILTAPLPPGPYACLMHALQDDGTQALAFPQAKGVEHMLFALRTHSSLAPHLKARGVIEGLIEAALSNDRRRLLRILQSAGGIRRGTVR